MFEGFGLFYLLTSFIGGIGWNRKQHNENKKSFKRTYNPKTNTYKDMFGVERRPNGDFCRTIRDPFTGDLVQRDKDFNIVRNFSAEERQKEASLSNATVIRLSDKNLTKDHYHEPSGIRYKDKQTGEEYVIRSFRVEKSRREGYCVYFYMKVSDATLVRRTDGEIKYGELKDDEVINKFIADFNEAQKKRKFFSVSEKYWNKDDGYKDRKPKKII